ncbi:MAG: AAA family ATPase, partial [Pseudomonadales bacterium]
AFQQETRAGRRVLLIVDEAQNLPPMSVEELRMLSNFQMDGKPLLQIFLLGQQEFRQTLLSEGFEQLRQRVIATYHLNPLALDETRTYIEHRLAKVGWNDFPRFTDSAFEAIFEFCDGVPRRINNLCDRLLLFAFLESLDLIDGEDVNAVAEEIGEEFLSGTYDKKPERTEGERARQEVFDAPDKPLESVARGLFDKADLTQRLATLERAIDGLGHGMKSELAEVREDLAYLRLLMEDLHQLVSRREDAGRRGGQGG